MKRYTSSRLRSILEIWKKQVHPDLLVPSYLYSLRRNGIEVSDGFIDKETSCGNYRHSTFYDNDAWNESMSIRRFQYSSISYTRSGGVIEFDITSNYAAQNFNILMINGYYILPANECNVVGFTRMIYCAIMGRFYKFPVNTKDLRLEKKRLGNA